MKTQYSLQEIDRVAADFVKILAESPSKVVAFYAEMGAGKTTFIKALCAQLGVDAEVNSPTFAIVNDYPSPNGSVFHFDYYRIKSLSEAYDIGSEDYFYSGCICLIEWPEKMEALLPEDAIVVRISVLDDGRREMLVEN
ncbi:MAG: tRNA (adenosine(37)-N6)-threonylcarbamoyltransferase complex ATPase subunit type 1 TsaE [Bacteroidales bacterium]|nr:tRNA (adenosine(37)-N6)-threonylcarbamoyltransferase complex ATPase subunit type 1 TsaE [Bacteroidales bacterium]MBO5718060.1 tRNA (adenosine(37)-N6)-threonylcarbamoyltransferase complex ATPase subunit type 1 TsaE [Bacteroidales bacterium]MBO5818504.1 tRNA (adenosine(37)-N6)-threonylcarbamoyltransferase complex ATPase subunit type 1 TsaE [Bacteroidales bacterium]MBO5834637.1 tRNA (adenosine(37)-N6)-threonylcarbamoyltransferase complex ATPase subunit type 1 TsaE [Bacteroidales bacterium]MBO58